MSAYQTLLARREAGVLYLTLNQPTSRNAMSLVMVRELSTALAEAEASAGGPDARDAIRVVVLRGAEGHFCSGGDLKDMASARMRPQGDGPDPLIAVSAAFGELCAAYAATPLCTIAVLEGSVMGGGFGLACAVDIAIATETAVFRLPEVHRGIVPAQIAPFLLERLGYSQAKRLAVSGASVSAKEALSLGLVHEVIDSAAGVLDPAFIENALGRVLSRVLQSAPGAVAATKALLARARFSAPGEQVAHAAAVFAAAARGAEGTEGMSAFIQKRKPAWAPAENEGAQS
jgi:isohexenylglutaconyl-CoA hydratase